MSSIIQDIKKNYVSSILNDTDKKTVLNELIVDGQINARYIFFSVIASAIATLGLLLNSPTVIIGAMLISPLMGPIVLQGFSISLINASLYKKSMFCLFVGTVLGILTSFLIVKLSPITNISSEILARTSPNLFDLLVAVFSGIAAAYVSIKQKGSAIVGAAIATALMPPLSVTGFGLATNNLWISKGSFFLFLTNFVAIALAVVFVAIFYGFFHYRKQRYLLVQICLSLGVLVILGIPLAISLKNIAYQSYVTKKAKNIITGHFNEYHDRLNDFKINFRNNEVLVDAVVITKLYKPKIKKEISQELAKLIAGEVKFNLTQIALTSDEKVPEALINLRADNILTNAGSSTLDKVDSTSEIEQQIIKQLWFPFKLVSVDQDSGIITIVSLYDVHVSIHNLRKQENTLSSQFEDWIVRVLPSQQKLPSIIFSDDQYEIREYMKPVLEDITWALAHWEIKEVVVRGYIYNQVKKDQRTLIEKENKLAEERVKSIAAYFEQQGYSVTTEFHAKELSPKETINPTEMATQRVEVKFKRNLSAQDPSTA